MKRESLALDIRKCLRCGRNHRGMVFTPFKRETPMEFKWWAMCPKTKEPLMVSVLLSEDPRLEILHAGGHSAELASETGFAKKRCPKCRRGPVIVQTYANEEVVCHCADCGNTWQPRTRK